MYNYLNMTDYTGNNDYAGPYNQNYYPAYQSNPAQGSEDSGTGGYGWGALVGGVANYASQKAAENQAQAMANLTSEQRLKLNDVKRDFQKQDQQYRKDSASRWSKYFTGGA